MKEDEVKAMENICNDLREALAISLQTNLSPFEFRDDPFFIVRTLSAFTQFSIMTLMRCLTKGDKEEFIEDCKKIMGEKIEFQEESYR
jgi:hypothetical protein